MTLAPAVRAARADLVQASKGGAAIDPRRSRLRTGLVAMQIGACTLFLVSASGLIEQTRHIANPDTRLSHERVANVQVTGKLRAAIAERLAARPDGGARRRGNEAAPGGTARIDWRGGVGDASRTDRRLHGRLAGILPDVRHPRSCAAVRLRREEADQNAPVVVVSEATARLLWPNLDPIGQTLEITPASVRRAARRPSHTSVRVIGVAEDVINGMLLDGIDETCIYFATSLRSPRARLRRCWCAGGAMRRA